MIAIQYYDLEKGLIHLQQYKAEKFIQAGCIVWDENKRTYICQPIKGYNTRTYTLPFNHITGKYSCNCQGYVKREKNNEILICSHILALILYFKQKNLWHN